MNNLATPIQAPIKIPNFRINEESGRYEATKALSGDQIIKAASKIIAARAYKNSILFNGPNDVKNYLVVKMSQYEREVFACMWLDNKHTLIEYEELFFGTIDGASVYPREIVKKALSHNAAAAVLVHNHPSGCCKPSKADIGITHKIKEALNLIDVRTLDHIIIGGGKSASLAEYGMI